jgi:mannose-6-phosphate isomerase-like protein (cupin superfamily)
MSFPFYGDPAAGYPPDAYHGDTGEASAWIRPARTPAEIEYTNGGSCEYLLTGPQSAGKLGIYKWSFGEDESGPSPHFHRAIAELFYVLEGHVRLYDGTGWKEAGAGDFLYVPEGGLHGFRGGGRASMLLMFTPGAPREDYFETLAALGRGGTMTDEDRAAFMLRHDTFWVDEE